MLAILGGLVIALAAGAGVLLLVTRARHAAEPAAATVQVSGPAAPAAPPTTVTVEPTTTAPSVTASAAPTDTAASSAAADASAGKPPKTPSAPWKPRPGSAWPRPKR